MCNDLLRQLNKGKRGHNLARYFANALETNKHFNQIGRPFIPDTRGDKAGTNPVARVMAKESPLRVVTPLATPYEFNFLQREIPHLRAMSKKEQRYKAWIDYVAVMALRPILGEIKWKNDKNPFYAFIQLLTYLSEMATPNQIKRAISHQLFGNQLSTITAFDLHIFLVNFNDQGGKGKLIDLTRQLANAFKKRLEHDYPEAANCLGNVLCIAGRIEKQSERFSKVGCLWMV
jgi:hypothetical protein